MSVSAARRRPKRGVSHACAQGSFAVMAGGWLVLFALLIAAPSALTDVWDAIRDLPLAAELVVWLVGFPFLVGLAIWQSSWDEPERLVAIAMLAAAYTAMFWPRA